jgi:hypothetical protein
MKTLRLALLALLVSGTVNAQFFQRVYGTAASIDVLESGTNYDYPGLQVGQKGQVMAGYTNFTLNNPVSPMVTRTLLNGNTFFNFRYILTLLNGQQIEGHARRVISMPGGRIAVFGDCLPGTTGQSAALFMLVLNANGTVVWSRIYFFTTTSAVGVEATSITQSVFNPADVYACATISDINTGSKIPVIMSVQIATGILNWGHEYFDGGQGYEFTVEDLVESPYPNVFTGGTDIALVGRYNRVAGGISQGCMFTIDAANGGASSFVHLYGNPSDEAGFTSIAVANSGVGTGPGYAVAGYTFDGSFSASYNAWALKLDPAGQVQFATMFDYSIGGSNNYANDIVERYSIANGDYEYYLGGYVDGGYFGRDDEVVFKLNSSLQPFGGLDEYTYGGPGNERVMQLDYYDNSVAFPPVPVNNTGLSMFNWTDGSFAQLGQSDFYHVKAYFSGHTACNFLLNPQVVLAGPLLLDSTRCDTMGQVASRPLLTQVNAMQNAIICTVPSIPFPASNARIADPAGLSGSSLFPNPVSAENPLVNITFDTPGANDVVEIDIWNALGQLVMHKRETLSDGQTQLQLNLGSELSSGVYNLTIRRGSELINHKVSVQ